jgi:putative acetyltransferase
MVIRPYCQGEELELLRLFFNTIHHINIRDYTACQIAAWAPPIINPELWRERMRILNPCVCDSHNKIVGYAGMDSSGYIDHFYVHHQCQRCGVGTLLYEHLEEIARQEQLHQLFANVSITARPFFEAKGFTVAASQEVAIGTERLQNFRMEKRLAVAVPS